MSILHNCNVNYDDIKKLKATTTALKSCIFVLFGWRSSQKWNQPYSAQVVLTALAHGLNSWRTGWYNPSLAHCSWYKTSEYV